MSFPGSDTENLFRPEAVDPETVAFNAKLAAIEATQAPFDEIGPVAARARRREEWLAVGGKPSALAQERSVPGAEGPISIRVLVPETVQGVYLHFHGGGMVLGDALYSDASNESIARNCHLAVVSVNYRLAPEHRYPAGPDDCTAVALWLVEQARAEFGTDTLLIGGESAGGNMSVVTLLRLRDRYGMRPFSAANLVFGVYDWPGTPSCMLNGDRTIALDRRRMVWFGQNYAADPDQLRDPDLSPLWADLDGLPPALFTVGTLDPLLDDSLFMHARWFASGNDSQLAIYPGGTHLFTGQPTTLGRQAVARIQRFLRTAATCSAR